MPNTSKPILVVLNQAMTEKGMSVLLLANTVGKHPSLIYQILRGEKVPSLVTALRISKALGRSVEELFGQLETTAS